MDEFKSISKFKVFNTNNLWANMRAIDRLLSRREMEMDVIVNRKVHVHVCVCGGGGRKLSILVGRLSILTGFCPVSCCYHKPLPPINFSCIF